MADADSSIEILIKTVLDATGYRMNEAEAQKLKSAVIQTSSASSVANQEDAKGTDKLILSKKELTHVINGLGGQAVPELGRALSSLAYGSGPVAAILLVVGAFQMVRKAVQEAQKADEDFNKTAANGDFAESIRAGADLMRDIVTAADDYQRKLVEIQRGEHGINAELTARLQLIAAIDAAQQSQADAKKTLALEQVKEDEIFGRITKSEAAMRRGEIEKASIEAKARAEEEKFTKEQQVRAAELDKAAGKQSELQKAADEATAKVNHAKAAQANAKDAPTREAVQKAQDEARKALEVFQAEWKIPMELDSPLPPGTSERSRIDQDAAKQQQMIADLTRRLFQQARQANGVNIGLLENDAKAKEEAALKNLTDLEKIRDEMNDANRNHTDPQVVRAKSETQRANLQTVDFSTAGELFKNAQGDIKDITRTAQGHGVNPADIAAARTAVSDLATTFKALVPLLSDLKQLGADKGALRDMRREIDDLKSRVGKPNN